MIIIIYKLINYIYKKYLDTENKNFFNISNYFI